MATHRDIGGSQQALWRGFAGGLAPEAAELRRFVPPGGSAMDGRVPITTQFCA
jgi:hypothetical protein